MQRGFIELKELEHGTMTINEMLQLGMLERTNIVLTRDGIVVGRLVPLEYSPQLQTILEQVAIDSLPREQAGETKEQEVC